MATYTEIVDPNNNGAAYLSLSMWEAGEQSLYSSGDIAIADCKRTGATKETNQAQIGGWTAGVIPKVIVNSSYRHQGKWADQRGDSNYIYVFDIANVVAPITTSVTGTVIDGVTFNLTFGAHYRAGVYPTGNSLTVTITNCLFKINDNYAISAAIYCDYASGTINAYDNIIFAATQGYSNGIKIDGTYTLNSFNNTVYGCGNGIARTNGTVVCKNCYAGYNTTDFSGTMGAASDYNVSADASAPGTNKATGKTAYTDYFVDPAGGDFHLKDASATLFGINSANLYSTFTKDIDGQDRPNSDQFGIGADFYVAAGGGTVYPIWRSIGSGIGTGIQ